MPDRVAIAVGGLVDGTGAPVVRDRVILVTDGVIEAIVPRAAAAMPTLDLTDCVVIPGLVDAHVHLCLDSREEEPFHTAVGATALHDRACRNARDLLRAGVTAVADCGGPTEILVELRDALARGDVRGPRLAVSGWPLTVPGGHAAEEGHPGVIEDDAEIDRSVATLAAAGVDFVKVMATDGGADPTALHFDVRQLMSIVTAAHDRGLPVAAHCHGTEGIRAALEAAVDRIEHCSFLGDRGSDLDAALVCAIADSGTTVCPTNSIDFRRFERGESGAPRAILVPAWRALVDAGVLVAGGSDAGVRDNHFTDYALVAELMVDELGMRPVDAIAACTHRAAQASGLGRELGTLEPGKRADLVALAGDPTTDIHALRQVQVVVQLGRVVDLEEAA